MRKYKNKKKILSFLIIIFLAFCYLENKIPKIGNLTKHEQVFKETNDLRIHFLDVSQGDSIFIELPNNETMLIDAGEKDYGNFVKDYISKLNYEKIDYVIGTHPHSDHIGGLAYVIQNFNIGKIYMPKAMTTTKTYEFLLDTISNKNLKITSAKANTTIFDNDLLNIKIISPTKSDYEELNNYSAVIKLTYKDTTYLFMGDAEKLVEQEIVDDVKADVIKVGHHGSDSSSSKKFLNKVKPSYAIISVGENNSYNHPSQNIIKRYNNVGCKVYRTDLNGTIIISSDGNNIEVNTNNDKEYRNESNN